MCRGLSFGSCFTSFAFDISSSFTSSADLFGALGGGTAELLLSSSPSFTVGNLVPLLEFFCLDRLLVVFAVVARETLYEVRAFAASP